MEILLLTGACGVGKSTIAKKWAIAKNGAVVECDYFTEWIYAKDFPKWNAEEERFVANLSAKVAIEYMKAGMPVAIENVWSPQGLQLLTDHLRAYDETISVKAIWLFCNITENHRRDELRIAENQMKERVDIVNKELSGYTWPSFVTKLNSTELTIEETLRAIEDI